MAEQKPRRAYKPKVEALEALRPLDAAAPSLLPTPSQLNLIHDPVAYSPDTQATWDVQGAAVDQFLESSQSTLVDPEATSSGLNQLNRYLARTWSRAGIAPHAHDDCTQGVFTSLLEQFGRTRFDLLVSDVGNAGIPRVLGREAPLGPDFLRAVDMIKKRAQREKHHVPIDEQLDVAVGNNEGASALEDWSGSIQDAITLSLNPREAELIRETMRGCSPSEIAERWGVAPKTVSNEKTRAFAKLREALGDDWLN
jgi:RNA polymerase sigma factor (sigma-70 family)